MAIINPLTLLTKLHAKLYYTIGSKTIDIHMSNNESLDEETKRLLAEVDSDESKESDKPKKKKIEWETNTSEDSDEEW